MGPALGVVPLPIEEVAAARQAPPSPQRHQPVRHIRCGATASVRSSAFTLELWFKRTGMALEPGRAAAVSRRPSTITKGRAEAETPANLNVNYFLGIDSATGVLVADFEDTVNGGNHPVTASTVVTNDVWHHAAATYSGSTWSFYLDGVLDGRSNLGHRVPAAIGEHPARSPWHGDRIQCVVPGCWLLRRGDRRSQGLERSANAGADPGLEGCRDR